MWEHLLPRVEIEWRTEWKTDITYFCQKSHSTPSTSGRGKSASWRRVESIMAFARMRVSDNLPKSWLVTSPSSDPLHLVRAASPAQMPQSEICPMSPFQMERRQYPQATWRRASAVFLIFFGQTRACLGCRARHIFPI